MCLMQLEKQLREVEDLNAQSLETFRANGVVYRRGDPEPHCSRCWDVDKRLVHLTFTSAFEPQCPQCKRYFGTARIQPSSNT